MKLVTRPLPQLLAMAHPENPKEHDVEGLGESILRFGFRAPPSIEGKVMVAGHGRCAALERLRASGRPSKYKGAWPPPGITITRGVWMVPVLVVPAFKSEDERQAYIVADNALVEAGGWSKRKLGNVLVRLKSARAGLGIKAERFERLIGAFKVKERPLSETTARPATFYLTVRGPVSGQPAVIEKLRAALSAMPDIEVIGHVEQDE